MINCTLFISFKFEVLLLKNIYYFRDGKFAETGQQFYFPDDVNLGYIIGKS